MENYQEFFSHAQLYTQVHAKPNQVQIKTIEEHYQKHFKEAQKEESKDNKQQDGESPSMSSPNKQLNVLSQVTNSYVAPSLESKGEYMQMDGITQGSFQNGQQQMPSSMGNQPKAAPKKANAAADSKKKWMRRI